MALLARVMERRGSIENPNTSLASPSLWLTEAFGGGATTYSGKRVTEEKAVESTTVFACVRVISEDLASLPVGLREKTEDGNRPRSDHPVHRLLAERPNPEMTPPVFLEAMQANLELWGNAYAEIERDGAGRPMWLWPIQARRVTPKRMAGRRFYEVEVKNGEVVRLPAENMLHVPGLGFDGLAGFSPISMMRQAVGLAIATEEFGARWFGGGSRAAGVIQGAGRMTDESYNRLRSNWERMHQGLDNAHRTAILEEGFTYQQVGIPPEDSQFLETRKFQVEEIARVFRVPLVLVGHTEKATSWGTGIEQFMRGYVTHTLRPKIVRWEHELDTKLLGGTERGSLYSHFRVEGLLRGDQKSRYEAYQIGRQNGWLNGNDIRRLEDLNPVDGLDEYMVNGAMVPVSQAGAFQSGAQLEGERALPERRDIETRQKRSLTARRRIQQQYVPLFREAAERFVRREVEAGRAAVRKHLRERGLADFDAWVDEFYPTQRDYVKQVLRSVFLAYAELIYAEAADEVNGSAAFSAEARDEIEEFLDLVAEKNTDASIGQLRALVQQVAAGDREGALDEVLLERLDEWEEKRAEKFAQRETVTLAGLATIAGYAANGVVRKRWVAFGDSCPLCRSMDGRTTEIRAPFLQPGDRLEPGGDTEPYEAPHSIPHPSLHRGCDCMILAE